MGAFPIVLHNKAQISRALRNGIGSLFLHTAKSTAGVEPQGKLCSPFSCLPIVMSPDAQIAQSSKHLRHHPIKPACRDNIRLLLRRQAATWPHGRQISGRKDYRNRERGRVDFLDPAQPSAASVGVAIDIVAGVTARFLSSTGSRSNYAVDLNTSTFDTFRPSLFAFEARDQNAVAVLAETVFCATI